MLEFWYQAAGSKLGIVIKTDNASATIQRLYQARKAANDPDLYKLHLRRMDPDEIWIVKNDGEEG